MCNRLSKSYARLQRRHGLGQRLARTEFGTAQPIVICAIKFFVWICVYLQAIYPPQPQKWRS